MQAGDKTTHDTKGPKSREGHRFALYHLAPLGDGADGFCRQTMEIGISYMKSLEQEP